MFKKPPFRIDEKGWGEFDMSIVLTAVGKGGDHSLDHDLNFQSERYEAKHQVVRQIWNYREKLRCTDDVCRPSGIPSLSFSLCSKSRVRMQMVSRARMRPTRRRAGGTRTSTWRNWLRVCRSSLRTTCFMSSPWSMTTRRARHTRRMMSRVGSGQILIQNSRVR